MAEGFFITGTDTSVGKTWATVILMRHLQMQGKTVVGMKPVASGCEWIDGKLRNADALLLQQNASVRLDYDLINPFAYQLPVSPHFADPHNPVRLDKIMLAFEQLRQQANLVLVEGVGGWLVPLNNQGDDVQKLAQCLNLPIIMVVAIRLGCLNHARLTYQAIAASGLNCHGWLAMCVEKSMLKQQENINTLKQVINAPLLGIIPYLNSQEFDFFIKNIAFAENTKHNFRVVL